MDSPPEIPVTLAPQDDFPDDFDSPPAASNDPTPGQAPESDAFDDWDAPEPSEDQALKDSPTDDFADEQLAGDESTDGQGAPSDDFSEDEAPSDDFAEGESSDEESSDDESSGDDSDQDDSFENAPDDEFPSQAASPAPEASTRTPPTDLKKSNGAARAPLPGNGDDKDRNDFLKSLMDGDGDVVPQKVELDLDGIFDMAKKEAENISPDSTFQPVEAPKPEEPAPVVEEVIDVAPLNSASQIKKVARFKMAILVGTLSVVVLGLVFVLYTLFFNKPKAPVATVPVFQADSLETHKEYIPGEMTLPNFIISLDDGDRPVVVEMGVILHYHDISDEPIIRDQIYPIRDNIYRITKAEGQALLTDTDKRVRFQANLLTTLNNLERIKTDPTNPRLTYVQISLLRRR
jgi:flagellar basal body-associated protein FliL